MSFDKELPGCFDGNLGFVVHPADEGRAFEWLKSLRTRNIGWKDASNQITEYLRSEGASPEHIERQVERALRFLKPWLLD
jgi:hypothetical protein